MSGRCYATYRVSWSQIEPCGRPPRHSGWHGPAQASADEVRPPAHYQQTSRLAYDSIQPTLGKLERAVFEVIAQESRTTDEVEVILGLSHQTVSARISTLWHAHGLIRPSGIRRRTSSGRLADVYECVNA